MGIFSRVSDIVNSNLNAMLDKAENPEKMVRLIIQEMEETLVEVRTSAARGLADKKELERRREVFQHDAAEWRHKAEIAVKRDRDDLARGALIESKKAAGMVDALSTDIDNIDAMLVKMNDDIGTLIQKLKDAKLRQAALVVRGRSAQARLSVRKQLTERNVDEAMIRFEKYERKIDDLEGAVESYDMGQRNLADEISELEADEQIENELQDLKRSMSSKEES